MSSQNMLYWSAKPVDSHAHLSSVLLALLKRWELKEAPRAYRSSQRRSESQRRSQIPKKRSQRQEGDIDCCSTRFVMHFDSAVRAAFSHALTMFPVQKPRKKIGSSRDLGSKPQALWRRVGTAPRRESASRAARTARTHRQHGGLDAHRRIGNIPPQKKNRACGARGGTTRSRPGQQQTQLLHTAWLLVRGSSKTTRFVIVVAAAGATCIS